MDYGFMKTGLVNELNHYKHLELDPEVILASLILLIEKTLRTSCLHAEHSQRKFVHVEDIIVALKTESQHLFHDPSLESDLSEIMELNKTIEIQEEGECEDASGGAMEEGEDEEDEEDEEDAESVEEDELISFENETLTLNLDGLFDSLGCIDASGGYTVSEDEKNEEWSRSECECAQCSRISKGVDLWSEWMPTDPLECIMKEYIEKINVH